MPLRAIFVAADGRPQPPWRILIFLVVGALSIQLVTLAFSPVRRSIDALTGSSLGTAMFAITLGLLLAHAIVLYWMDKRTWSYVGLHDAAARVPVLARGWLLGAVPILAPALVLLAVGWLSVRRTPDGPWWLAAGQVSLFLLPAALSEELLTRGYVFATLREWLGVRTALVLTSVGFGLMHLGNAGADARSVLLVTLAGLFLGVVLIATGSLYAAWMAHWAWNWIMAVPLHAAVSGVPFAQPDYQIVDSGPDWITGGAWGPEGGAAAAVGMLVALAYVGRRAGLWVRRTPHQP